MRVEGVLRQDRVVVVLEVLVINKARVVLQVQEELLEIKLAPVVIHLPVLCQANQELAIGLQLYYPPAKPSHH